jgi:cytosine/adenosine deaminase-related metal-dependent hydrolase
VRESRIVIRGATVVTLDDRLGDLPSADVLIEGAEIVAIGADLGIEDAEIVDGEGRIIVPGFVNTHLHTWQHALRGVCADWTVKDYVRCWRVHLGPIYRPDDMYVGNFAGALDALNAGVTTIVDYCHNIVKRDHGTAALAGLMDAGGRAVFGYAFTPVLSSGFAELPEVENPDLPDHASRIRFAQQLAAERFPGGNGLVSFAIVPQEIEISPWDEVTAEFGCARELAVPISLHANQVLARRRWEDVARLHRAGLLGDDILFVHCTFSSDEELKLLAASGASVSVQAETEMQMGMGRPITGRLIEHGVAPCLGVDITSNGSGDMFAQMRLALQTARMLGDQRFYDESSMPEDVSFTTRDALRWATINGAVGVGLGDQIGTLVPGKQADLVVINGNDFNLIGWNREDPVGTVVLHAHPGNVETVLVAGRPVKRAGAMTAIDPLGLRRRVEDSAAWVRDVAEQHGGILPQPRTPLSF